MGQKDIISKQLIKRLAVDLAVYLLGLDIAYDELELLATEQQRVEERRVDLICWRGLKKMQSPLFYMWKFRIIMIR